MPLINVMDISRYIEKLRLTNTQRYAGIYGIDVISVVRQDCKGA
jgi:hypothetical protein